MNTFTAIHSDNEWLKRYLPDGHNSQTGKVQNKIEVTTEDGKKWYRLRIPYLCRFYNTEVYLVGQENNGIYALKGKEKEVVCVRTMWTPNNLVALEELLMNDQYLRLKGIKRFKEEDENIINRLVSIKERSLPKGIDLGKSEIMKQDKNCKKKIEDDKGNTNNAKRNNSIGG